MEIKYLEEVKYFCEQNSKVLILFTSVYNDNCKTDNLNFKNLMNQFNFTYYDFSDLLNNYKDIKYWKNENHLSKKGADLFSRLLYDEIKNDL